MKYKDMDRFDVEYLESRMRQLENRLDRLGVKDDPEVRLELGRIHEVIEKHKTYRYEVVIEGYGPSPFSTMGCLFGDDREEEMVYNVDVLFSSDSLDEAREYMNAHAVRCARLYIRHKGGVVEEYEPPKTEKPVWNALPEGVHEIPELNARVTVKDGKASIEPLERR